MTGERVETGSMIKTIFFAVSVVMIAMLFFWLGRYVFPIQQYVQPPKVVTPAIKPAPPQTIAQQHQITHKMAHALYLGLKDGGLIVRGNPYDDFYIMDTRQFHSLKDQELICRLLYCEYAFETGEEPYSVLFFGNDRMATPLARYDKDKGFTLEPAQ